LPETRRERLERLRDRFLAVSLRSRSLRLTRESASGALDLARLEDPRRILWLVKALGEESARPGVLAEVATGAAAGRLSLDVAALAHAARDERMQTGADNLAVGWPFFEGRAADGTWLRAPVLLFPVALGQTAQGRLRWTLEPLGPPEVNEPLLTALGRVAGVRMTGADVLGVGEAPLKIDEATWLNIIEAFQAAGLALHETPPRLPELAPLPARDKAERDGEPLDRFRLRFHLVLGRFPAAASNLALEYDALLAGDLGDERLGLAARLLEVDEDAPSLGELSDAPPPSDDGATLGDLRRWQPLPSDASQDAVFRFLEGRPSGGLVVQGPPGTGKSQLIANLLAAAVARGDRVLLVCQKRAALDVVADRLGALGLRDTMALVHDVRRDRNEVCQGISDTLERVLDGAMATAGELRHAIERATSEHERAKTRVQAMLRASQEAWRAVASRDAERPGLAELDERILLSPDGALPDLADLVAEVTEDDVIAASADLDQLAVEAAPLARPHPLWQRTSWAGRDPNRLDATFNRLRRLAAAIEAWAARHPEGHLSPDAVDAHARRGTWAAAQPLAPLLGGRSDQVRDFVLFWAWCGGESTSGMWSRLFDRLERARAELAPVPRGLITVSTAELEARAGHLDRLAALEVRWYRFFVFRFWSLRRLERRLREGLGEPLEAPGPSGLAELHRHAVPWHGLLASLPEEDLPELRMGFQGDPAQIDDALARMAERHAQVAAVHGAYERLSLEGGPFAAAPAVLEGDLYTLDDVPFFAGLAAELRRAAALEALDEALAAVAEDFAPAWRARIRSVAVRAPEEARAEVEAAIAARPEAAAAEALDRRLAGQPAWAVAFLRGWRVDVGRPERPSAAAQRAVERGWRAAILDGRTRAMVEGPALNPAAQAELEAAVATQRELAVSGIQARYQTRLLDLADDEAGRRALQRLLGEARKRRYRATLRQLMERYWRAGLAEARPVWLCTPESVAALFPLDADLFDLVIFDEASQCPVESAVPALVRARRAVIAGDDQQMPPTHFFRAGGGDSGEDEETELLASQSILALARIAFPGMTLRWHYRCRHEPLIAFSNAAFYARRLATVPNAEERALGAWEGLRFERVPGLWQDQTNPVEAEVVVDALDRLLAEEVPGGGPPSVGIVTFNKRQAELVEALIEARASLDQGFRERFMRDRERPDIDQLFVRNLENVQGDERDVILMSLGYGPPEPGGRVAARFGPLGQEGGEKRLNVAVTRARLALWLFASFEPGELDVSGTRHPGPKLLHVYLRYVRAVADGDEQTVAACLAEAAALGGGRGVTAGEGAGLRSRRPGLVLRDALAVALDARGYRVKKGLGLGRLSLDIGVGTFEDERFRIGVDTSGWLEAADPMARELYIPTFWRRLGWTLIRVTPGWWREDPGGVLEVIDRAVDGLSGPGRGH